jgi:hypothetical protein
MFGGEVREGGPLQHEVSLLPPTAAFTALGARRLSKTAATHVHTPRNTAQRPGRAGHLTVLHHLRKCEGVWGRGSELLRVPLQPAREQRFLDTPRMLNVQRPSKHVKKMADAPTPVVAPARWEATLLPRVPNCPCIMDYVILHMTHNPACLCPPFVQWRRRCCRHLARPTRGLANNARQRR